jgi:spore germination cell wall hydrolase CwlJ-like protein
MTAQPTWAVLRRKARLRWVVPAMLALLALVLLTAGLLANVNRRIDPALIQKLPPPTSAQQNDVALPNLLKPLTAEEAVKENLERPFNATPDTPAQQFNLRTDTNSRDRAVECLAQAVYYEAATEGADGQRAVAQVVLNRMRHPGFPATVCGVVYQGSDLPTGCQFTFTCDGSLARTPIPSIWAQARRIASEALAGRVFAPVGHATHYHADYVLPYWADSLLKQVQIGHHIFYRLTGSLGSRAAFSQRYGGAEPPPPLPSAVAVAAQAADQGQALLTSGISPTIPLAADAAGVAGQGVPKEVLLADNNRGELLIDRGSAPAPSARRRSNDDCSAGGSKRISPETPKNLHAGSSSTGC